MVSENCKKLHVDRVQQYLPVTVKMRKDETVLMPARSAALDRSFVVVLGGVKTKDVLSLAGARIDCAQVLASLHFPNSRDYSIFLHCVISNLFSACFRRRFGCWGRGALAIAVSFSDIRTQTFSNLLVVGIFRWGELLHTRITSVQPNAFARAISTAFLGTTTPQPCRSTSTPATRSAVSIKMRFTCCGVSFGFASSMHATIDETIGAANDVPSTNL